MRKAIPAHKTSPAFCILKEGKCMPIIYKQFQNKLRSLIEKTGRKPKYYSSHSFRRGGASLAFESNVTTELIQLHGDWRSDAYKEYLEFSLEKKLMVSRKMRDEICAKKLKIIELIIIFILQIKELRILLLFRIL